MVMLWAIAVVQHVGSAAVTARVVWHPQKNETLVALKWPLHMAWQHQSVQWGQHSETGARHIYNSCLGDDSDGNSRLGT